MQSKFSTKKRFNFEQLENRLVMAGNVEVGYSGSGSTKDLVITGDASANEVEVYQPSTLDAFVVRGRNNTRINGVNNGSFSFNIYNYTDDIQVNMNGGHDKLIMRGADSGFGDLDVWNDLNINMGSGNDRVELRYVETGGDGQTGSSITIDTGTGTDYVKLRYIDVQDDLIIRNSTVSQASRPEVQIDLYDTYVGDNLDVDLYNSVGLVNMRDVNARDLYVDLYGANDKLNLKRTRARTSHSLDGGDGTDTLNLYNNPTSFKTRTSFKAPTSLDTWYS
jgi:hypothetical protein